MPVIIDEHTQYFNNGASVVNGFVYIGEVNTDPTILANRLDLFSDGALTTIVPNPQRTNARGQTLDGPIFTAEGSFSFELQNSGSVVIESILSMGATAGGLSLTTLSDVVGINALTAKGDPIVVVYVDKQQFSLTIISEPTGPMTLDIDGNGVVPIKNKDADIVPGQFPANGLIVVAFNIIGPVFELVSGANLSVPSPIGDVTPNSIEGTTIEGTTITANGSFIPSQGVAVASATQPNIWAGDGNTIHITGTTQIDDFTNAPRIGAKVTLIFDDILILKNGLGITLQGEADITTAAGDRFDVYADAVDAFSGVYTPIDAPPAAFASQLLHIQDQKPNGTAGGTTNAGSYQTRNLNTILTNEITGASLSSDQITLPAGEYYLEASAPAFTITRHKARWRDITTGTTLLVGTSEHSAGSTQTPAFVFGRFTLASEKVLELQHRTQASLGTNGFGVESSFGDIEIYSNVKIWKVG